MSAPRRRPPAAALAVLLVLAALSLPAAGQELGRLVEGPRAPWRVIETEHFRVHYPEPAAAWAERAAARLEAVRERVAAEVGFAPEQVVDVVISDPVAQPNGFALPFLGRPRMVLWTRPPRPESVIGHYRDWGELLIVHEDTHLVHLLRPSRNPTRRALAALLPLGPITRQAPRWVTEGYATLVEGRLTGSGRPHGDLRAAILRRWAMAGKLPSYGALAGNRDYLGQSMAYLAGSAYLGWLEERAGEGTLRDLWARMTARRVRDFEEAFAGVFADSPADLWDRFRAETSWQAIEIERRVEAAGGFVEGEPWMDLAWQTGAPALSPDGERLAIVLADRDDPPELAVFATAVDQEAAAERARRRAEIAARDPEDVPAVDTAPPPRRRLHTLPTVDFAPPSEPRWMPDGESLLLVRTLPDAEGFLHPDLFRWTPETGEIGRLTSGADLTQPDPAPDGAWAAAVESRHGATRLVRVDLATGAVTPLTEATVEVVVDRPRVSPDGGRLLYARHAAGRWGLVVRRLADGAEEELPLPAGATVASPAWGRGGEAGTVFASVGVGGFIDLYAFAPEAGGGWRAERRTRTRGAAFAPEPGDGEVFFLSLEPDGLDLRRLAAAGCGEETGVGGAGGEGPANEVTRAGAEAADEASARRDAGADDGRGTGADGARGEDAAGERSAAGEEGGGEEGGGEDEGAPDEVRAVAGSADAVSALSDAVPAVGSSPTAGAAPLPPLDVDLAGLAPAIRPAPLDPPPPPLPAAEPPPSRPYGVGRQELLLLSGGSTAPSNEGIELGIRGGDLLGRLDWVVTAGFGDAALAEGGAVAAAWRGPTPALPLDLSLHLFAVRERPSRQPEEAPGLGRLLDVDREGGELVAAWERRTRPGSLRLAGGVYLGRVEAAAGPNALAGALDERSLFAAADWRPRWGRGPLTWGIDLAARAETAESGDLGWDRVRGALGLGVGYRDSSLRATWSEGRIGGDAPAWHLFELGGVSSSLLPETVEAARLLVPALPLGTRVGDELSALRVDLDLDALPLPLFWGRYEVGGGLPGERALELAGAELRLRLGPVPLVRLPVLDLTLGAAYVFDDPFADDVHGWVAVAWRP